MPPPLFPPFAPTTEAPADQGYLGRSYDNAMVQAGLILPTAGLLNLVRVRVLGTLVTNVHLHFTVAGGTLTAGQNFAALFDSAGTLLSATADQATTGSNWQAGGMKDMPLAVAQAVTYGAFYYVGFYANGSTMPTVSRAVNSASAILNGKLAAPNFRYATANAGLTTAMPASFGAQTGTATAWWAGVS